MATVHLVSTHGGLGSLSTRMTTVAGIKRCSPAGLCVTFL